MWEAKRIVSMCEEQLQIKITVIEDLKTYMRDTKYLLLQEIWKFRGNIKNYQLLRGHRTI